MLRGSEPGRMNISGMEGLESIYERFILKGGGLSNLSPNSFLIKF